MSKETQIKCEVGWQLGRRPGLSTSLFSLSFSRTRWSPLMGP